MNMNIEQTLAIIKPDAVAAGVSGQIIDLIEKNGFAIVHMEKGELSAEEAAAFYEMHRERSFFGELVEFMSSGPIVVMLLERADAVAAWRDLMGATNPRDARVGTIRYMFATDVGKNATHGSDSLESAEKELEFFFGECE